MAQFDVYHLLDGGLVVDCQSDLLEEIGTRFVLPLMPPGDAPPPNPHLNPEMHVNGESLRLVPQFAMAIRTSELRLSVTSLAGRRDAIVRAIDALIGGV